MQIIRRIKLDFARESHTVKIFAKQGDINSRYVEIEPLENGLRYQIPDGVIARFAAKKPDGTEIFNDYPTISKNIITVVLTEQTLAAAGDVECDIQLYKEESGQVLKAQTFVIRVRPDVLKNAKSSNEYQSYEAALLKIEDSKVQAVAAVEAAENALTEAEAALAKVDEAQDSYDQMMREWGNVAGIVDGKIDKTSIAQELGDDPNKVLSQKAATDAFNKQSKYFFDVKSVNRIKAGTLTENMSLDINTGVEYTNEYTGKYITTDYIDITGNNGFISAYKCLNSGVFYGIYFRIVFYDKAKNYVFGSTPTKLNGSNEPTNPLHAVVPVPENAYYVRVVFHLSEIDRNYMLVLDDDTTRNYTPYHEDIPPKLIDDAINDAINKAISDSINDAINANNENTKPWKGKAWLSYGDSITAIGNGADNESGWQKYVTDALGFSKCYGRGIGGQVFRANVSPWFANADGSYHSRKDGVDISDTSSYTIPDGCTAHYGYHSSWDRIKTMISDDIKDEIDLIFLFGVNDCWAWSNGDLSFEPPTFSANNTTDAAWANAPENVLGGDFDLSNFIGAVASTIMKLQARCPNAMIVFGTSWSGRSDSDTNANSAGYSDMGKWIWKEGELVKQIANYFSIPCVDIWARSGVNPFNRSEYITDTIHPYCDKGKKALARAVIDGLRGIYPRFDT